MTDRSKPLPPEYWLGLATEDLACATAFPDMESAQPRHSVGLASQAAEKALKALIALLPKVQPVSRRRPATVALPAA